MSTSTTAFTKASFLNLFGIVVSIVLCILFIVLGGHTLKYIKEFACKIKIIVNRAEDKKINLKQFNYQPRDAIAYNQSYQQWEAVFKNEIKKSRSLQYCNILGSLLAKYDHVLYYPFRDRTSDQFNMLKPKTTFYTLLVVTSCCIAWMSTILLSAVLQNLYSDISTIPLGVFIGLTVAIALISSILNIICVNRLFRIYVLNIKGAFKIDYGLKFVGVNDALQEYEPENSIEEEELLRAQEKFNTMGPPDDEVKPTYLDIAKLNNEQRDDALNINSTRRLLPPDDDFERSDLRNTQRAQKTEAAFEKSSLVSNQEAMSVGQVSNSGKRIKDIFNLQVNIEGVDDADGEEKYIFVEDKHAIGDTDLLDNEAFKGENQSNITTFVVLFIIIAASSAICCYLNYTFSKLLSQYVFYMFAGAFFGDFLVMRVLLCMILALFKLCSGFKRGYRKIQYKQTKDIKQAIGKAIQAMMENKMKVKETRGGRHSKQNSEQFSSLKGSKIVKQNDSGEGMIGGYQSTHNFAQDEDQKEEYSHQVEKAGAFEDGIAKVQHLTPGSLETQMLRPANSPSKESFTTQAYNTNVPLLANLQKQVREKQDEEHENLMDKKHLVNELVDYNLLLLRKIYDAFEDRADKVMTNFRTDKRAVIRKRYMVPILNPNYDYERLLREMKQQAKDKIDEDEVKLDGETVCGDQDQQLMEAILQEASDDLVQKEVNRQRIDKFGNPIDEEAKRQGIAQATPAPLFKWIEIELEENLVEDDEDSRKRAILDELRRRLAAGEALTEEELQMLWLLEEERIRQIEARIKEIIAKGDKMTDDDRIEIIDLKSEKLEIEKARIMRKKQKSQEDQKRIGEIEQELKRLELEKLKLLQKLGRLTPEQLLRLQQLEAEFNNAEIEALLCKLRDGTLTQEELARLQALLKSLGIDLSQSDQQLLRDLMKKYGLLSQDEMDKDLIEELRQKLANGTLNKEELIKLRELEKQYGIKFTDDEQVKLRELEKQFGLIPQEELDKELISELRNKLANGTLSKDELLKLRQLEQQYNLNFTPEEQKKLRDLEKQYGLIPQEELDKEKIQELRDKLEDTDRLSKDEVLQLRGFEKQYQLQLTPEEQRKLRELEKEYGMLSQEELEMDELERLRRKLLNGDITEEELRRLMELMQKYGIQLSDEELAKMREAEDLFGWNEHSRNTEKDENFSELPPVVVMNKPETPPNVFENNLQKVDEEEEFNLLDQQPAPHEEEEDLTPKGSIAASNDQYMQESRIEFGREDIEKDQAMRQALDPENQEESIYSHRTTTILDEEKVSFMHIEHLPNQDNGSEDSFSEQDMVYYNKDDLTNYSKNLGLNKVKAKQQLPLSKYYSENDLHEVEEQSLSENDQSRLSGRSRGMNKARSAMSLDSSGERQRAGYSRGNINHNQLSPEDHSDLIDGRVKVDSWNLNYHGKKKKHKQRKVTKAQKKKMADLQDIYGIDAKTLAGISKGRLPRKLLASGKLGGGKPGAGGSDGNYMTEMSFRSTQNTFANKMTTAGKSNMKQSINDNTSNMFSFNGNFGTNRKWGDTEMQRGHPSVRDSKQEVISQYEKRQATNRKGPQTGKMTSTQQNFGPSRRPYDQNEFLQEESKSMGSSGRGSVGRRFQSQNDFRGNGGGFKFGSNGQTPSSKYDGGTSMADKKGNSKKKSKKKKLIDLDSDGIDSHTESDEAVDDKGAMFHKGGQPFRQQQHEYIGGMNDEGSESEENIQENPDFRGNDHAFKKRAEGNQRNLNNGNQLKKAGGAASTMARGTQGGSKNRKGKQEVKSGSRSSGRLQLEDLEAQSMNQNQKNRRKLRQPDRQVNQRTSSAERDDSEEENMGGLVNFQKHPFNESDGLSQNNAKKPSGKKQAFGSTVDSRQDLNNLYGDPYNIDGRIHPGVSREFRQHQPGNSDISDNEQIMRGTKYSRLTEDDDQMMNMQGPRFARNGSNQDLLNIPGGKRGSQGSRGNRGGSKKGKKASNKKYNVSANLEQMDSDDQNDFIIGPESNHSTIQKRALGKRGSQANQSDDDNEEYLLIQRERQMIEDIESNANENSRLAKKRKIRKAAKSHNNRDSYANKVQEMQNARLQKQKREAEKALIKDGDLEAGLVKKKKKKVKKDWVKKEINYWLDYDSPYAEYLVARFREWSPSPAQIVRGGSSNSGQRQHNHKYAEMQQVYKEKHGGSRQGSKQNSRSPNKAAQKQRSQNRNNNFLDVDSAHHSLDNSQRKMKQQSSQPSLLPPNIQNVNAMFVDDFEEP